MRRSERDEVQTIYAAPVIKKTDFEALTSKLENIFEMELKSKSSIFVSVDRQIIKKLAMFLCGKINRPAAVGIAGVTASGKSTIAIDIIDTLENFACENELKDIITRINTDDYYLDRSKEVNEAGSFANFAKTYDFDVPWALELDLMVKHISQLTNGFDVFLPKYDMSGTAIRFDNHTLAKPAKIIITEGLFTLNENIKGVFDFKIYVDIDEKVQKQRFFRRANERGLGSSAYIMYERANEKAKEHVEPTVKYADIILSGEAHRYQYKLFLDKILNIVKEFCL